MANATPSICSAANASLSSSWLMCSLFATYPPTSPPSASFSLLNALVVYSASCFGMTDSNVFASFTALSYFVDFFITVSLMLRQKYYEGVPIIIIG